MTDDDEPELVEDSPSVGALDPGVGEQPSRRRHENPASTEDEKSLPGVPKGVRSRTEQSSVLDQSSSGKPQRNDGKIGPNANTSLQETADERRHHSGTNCDCHRESTSDSDTVEHSADAPPRETDPVTDGAGPAIVGDRPTNVSPDGELTDLEFTEPAADVSQPLPGEGRTDPDPPDERVNLPGEATLSTPGLGIRDRMSDIEKRDEKTWFMELDEGVIDAGRCIQCGTCVAACPSDSIGIGEDGHPELIKMCTGCSLCWDFCPRGGLRYERQWKITGGEDNVTGAGDPITEFSARVREDWQSGSQDGGAVTAILLRLLEAGEIDGAIIATESAEDPWKAEGFLATEPAELVENTGTIYNQTMALGHLDFEQWEEKLPDKDWEDVSLALVGTPCEIEGIRALQDFEWEYGAQEAGVRAVDYRIALMCTKNFNYERLIGDKLRDERGIDLENVGKLDVLDGKLMVDDREGNRILTEDIEHFHDAALKGCDECADFTGLCADLTVGSVGSSDEFSSVIVRTERGLEAWNHAKDVLEYHDLEDRSAVGKLQGWDKKKAFESLERPFDPDAPRFIEYTDHVENYGGAKNPHETDS